MKSKDNQAAGHDDLPRRPKCHVIGDYSEKVVADALPDTWIVQKEAPDYGIDLRVQIVKGDKIPGDSFSIQVKGIKSALKHQDSIRVLLRASTINYWHRRPERVMLAVHIVDENATFWLWADAIPKPISKTSAIQIPRSRKLEDTGWNEFVIELERYHRAIATLRNSQGRPMLVLDGQRTLVLTEHTGPKEASALATAALSLLSFDRLGQHALVGDITKALHDGFGRSLAETVGFDLLDEALGQDVQTALAVAFKEGAVFCNGSTPLAIFRQALATAIGRIHEDGRAPLFLRFLKDGPYEDVGDIPPDLQDKRLTDDETTSVITFIYSHMVNYFKGALTEMLAVAPCLDILHKLQAERRLPREARLYVGDAVWAASQTGMGFGKGADLHILVERRSPNNTRSLAIGGVAEVKSYFCRPKSLRRQLDQHLVRARRGLRVGDVVFSPEQIAAGWGNSGQAARITVLPAHGTLPRTFRFEHKDGRKFLHVDPGVTSHTPDSVVRVGPMAWRVTLRWSKEALDAAAYGMTFWFMEKVGEVLYSSGVPKDWAEMTPAEAGQNAAKMMLYYAILRCRTVRENQRAIALYNSYNFGYALGMNFRNPKGQREMLWPQDLDEILAKGRNKDGCRIV